MRYCNKKVQEYNQITFWLNFSERKVSQEQIRKIKDFVVNKVDKILWDIENNWWFVYSSIEEIQNIRKQWYRFERNNFETEEVFELWWKNFDWTREDIRSFIQNNQNNNQMFWLRNVNWILVALMMFWDDSETTEWWVLEEYQWQWLIVPLLLTTHGLMIQEWRHHEVYAHLRWNRSIWPWLKSWLRIDNTFWTDNILYNHVEVEWNLEHFVEWILDSSLFSDLLLCEINKFIFSN